MSLVQAITAIAQANTIEEISQSILSSVTALTAVHAFYIYDKDADAFILQGGKGPRILSRIAGGEIWRAHEEAKVLSVEAKKLIPLRAAAKGFGVLVVQGEALVEILAITDIAAMALERLQLRRQQLRERALLDVVFALSDDGLVAAATTGELLQVNQRMEEICGWKAEELQRLGWFECLYPDPEARARAVLSVRAAFHGAPASGIPWRITHRNGHTIDLILHSRAVFVEGQPAFVVGHLQDITAEQRIRQEAQRSERYEELGRLASAVAHDFNNLVAAVQGHAELLIRRYEGEVAERASIIRETANRASTLTRQLVNFGREQAIWRVATDLEPVCTEILQSFQKTVSSVSVKLEVTPGTPAVDLDAQAFGQLLTNLLLNAHDALGKDGHITVQISTMSAPIHPLKSWGEVQANYVRVRVYDNGHGIAPANKERIFEPFFTTRPAGHGLGLAVVARIAEAHQALIDVPELPMGTAIDVYLPISNRPAVILPQQDPEAGTERVWVVDDNVAVLDYLVTALEAFGYRVRRFEKAQDVLAAIDAGEGYELLVSDISMPEMDGIELHYALKARGVRRPVLFCSGYSERAASVPTGRHVEFLQKPLSMRVLAQRVRRLLNYTLPDQGS